MPSILQHVVGMVVGHVMNLKDGVLTADLSGASIDGSVEFIPDL